jgi:hypothetical protein
VSAASCERRSRSPNNAVSNFYGRVGYAPVGRFSASCLPGRSGSRPTPPSSTAASPNTQATRKTVRRQRQGQGKRQRPKYEHSHERHSQAAAVGANTAKIRDLRSRLQHGYLPRTRSSAAYARAVAPGMFPHVGRGPLLSETTARLSLTNAWCQAVWHRVALYPIGLLPRAPRWRGASGGGGRS